MSDLKNTQPNSVFINPLQMRENSDIMEIDLKELFWELFNHIGVILICMILGAMLAFFPTWYLVTPQYKSTAKLYIVSASNDSVINLTDLQIGSQLTSDYKELIKSYPVMNEVSQNLGLNMDASALTSKVSISNPSDTRILAITVSDANPNTAAKIANAVAELSVKVLPEIMESEAPNVVEYARPADSPYSPNYTKNTIVGAFAGTAFACGVIVLRMLLNDTFTSADDFVRILGNNPLAVVPEMTGVSSKRGGYNSYYKEQPVKNEKKSKSPADKQKKTGSDKAVSFDTKYDLKAKDIISAENQKGADGNGISK